MFKSSVQPWQTFDEEGCFLSGVMKGVVPNCTDRCLVPFYREVRGG